MPVLERNVRRRCPARRMLLIAILCLISGAVVTVLISWASALWVRQPVRLQILTPPNAQWPVQVPSVCPAEPFDSRRLMTSRVWRIEQFENSNASSSCFVGVRSTGWPLPALWGATAGVSMPSGGSRLVRQIGFFFVPRWVPQFRPPDPPQFPMWIPAPIGFTLDTIFYAAFLAVLAVMPGRIRAVVRRRAGRCLACGYDLRGLPNTGAPCPECGGVAI